MAGPHFDVVMDVKTPKERRRQERHTMDCRVTVLPPGRGRKRAIGHGWLKDISDQGARFGLDHPVEVGSSISLDVHFSNPDGETTTIRFRAIVLRLMPGTSQEIAVSFLGGGSFVRRKNPSKKGTRAIRPAKGRDWVN